MNNQTFIQKIKSFISNNKVWTLIILVAIIALFYFIFFKGKTSGEATYLTTEVKSGDVVVTVTGTGQVESSNSIDLKAKVSSEVTYIWVKAGDIVKRGKTLFSLDATDARKTVRDAEISLESAKLSLEKLKIQNSEENMSADLLKAYDDGFSSVSNTFLDLPTIIIGLESVLGAQNLSDNAARYSGNTALSYRDSAEKLYYQAENAFWKNRVTFRTLDRNSPKADIENIINETYKTTVIFSDAIKNIKNFVDYMADDTNRPSEFTSSETTLSGYTTTINTHLSNLFGAKTDIKNYKDTSLNSNLDIQSSELSVKQKENSLQDAKDNLSDYYVSAPFDGTISSVIAKLGDISSGVLASIITKEQLATISLNEVDIAKIKLGQKATLTFDAISDLSINGIIAEIDSTGTVSQGVVTYNVKISFDTVDSQIKPGMSVSASIITDMAQGVLVVPNSAVKTEKGVNYVETLDGLSLNIPRKIKVEIGLMDDIVTEIIGGLKLGDIVITKTITSNTKATTTQTPSIFGSMGGGTRSGATGARTGGGGGSAFPRN